MGLDFSHTRASWSYSGFGHFREALAQHAGFTLDEMVGFGGTRTWDNINTPLKPLLNHSDCDGDLSPKECAELAPALRKAIDAIWPEYNSSHDHDRQHGLLLAEGMEQAAARGERLEFC